MSAENPAFRPVKGRFAPTPSGNMHIGNAFCYLLAWLSARSQGGEIVLRLEDADLLRMRPSAVEQTFSDLLWLGLDWDEGPRPNGTGGTFVQSRRTEIYEQFFEELRQNGQVYPCFCTRQDVRNAAAPHETDQFFRYPGTCRPLNSEQIEAFSRRRKPAWRLRLENEEVTFEDEIWGKRRENVFEKYGDCTIRRADGVFCYQFTTALDDALMGVSEVVRSRDLLDSTPWQVYIQRLFGFTPPRFAHIPMLLDEEGKRMAKRDFSLSLREIRNFYTPEEVLGKLGFLAGLLEGPESCSLRELLALFSWERLPREDILLPKGLF